MLAASGHTNHEARRQQGDAQHDVTAGSNLLSGEDALGTRDGGGQGVCGRAVLGGVA